MENALVICYLLIVWRRVIIVQLPHYYGSSCRTNRSQRSMLCVCVCVSLRACVPVAGVVRSWWVLWTGLIFSLGVGSRPSSLSACTQTQYHFLRTRAAAHTFDHRLTWFQKQDCLKASYTLPLVTLWSQVPFTCLVHTSPPLWVKSLYRSICQTPGYQTTVWSHSL